MIGQRLAGWGTAVLPAARRHPRSTPAPAPDRRLWKPVAAGWESLVAFLRRSILLQLMLVMALISFAALIYLNQAGKESVLQFSINNLQRQQIELNLRNANLYASASTLTNVGRIQSIASTQLQMTQPGQAELTWISPVVPRVAPLPPDTAATSAQQRSEPLVWMQHAIQFLAAQF
jgi:cell division protein FtsL